MTSGRTGVNRQDTQEGQQGQEGMTFEAAMMRLEQLVRDLENGKLTLDESIQRFEEGMRLVRRCAEELRRVEDRVKRLTEEAGRILIDDLGELGSEGSADNGPANAR